jgi:hypothetical protein
MQGTKSSPSFATADDREPAPHAPPAHSPSGTYAAWRRSTFRRRVAALRGHWYDAHDLVRSDDVLSRP